MDGEVVDALLGLLDEGVAEDLPGELFGLAVHLFQRLVDGHGADGHGAVADDPLAGFVDVLAGGQIHHRVAAPAGGPGHLVHFLVDGGAERRVADVGVDLHQEVAADDHRLTFRVVDVVGDDGAAAGDFGAHELGGDFRRDRRAEVLALVLAAEELDHLLAHRAGGAQVLEVGLAVHVLADRHVFHLGGDDPLAGVVHLGDVLARQGAARLAVQAGEAEFVEGRVGGAGAAVFGGEVGEHLGVAALLDPALTQRRQAGADVDLRSRVGVGARAVVDEDRRVLLATEAGGRVGLAHFAHRHAEVRAGAFDVDLAGVGQRGNRSLVHVGRRGEEFIVGVH